MTPPIRSESRHVFLMRHAEHKDGSLTEAGRADVAEVARTLAGLLPQLPRAGSLPVTLDAIWCAPTGEARSTAWQLAHHVAPELGGKLHQLAVLDPKELSVFAGSRTATSSVIRELRAALAPSNNSSPTMSVLVVGHLPLLGWVAKELTGAAVPMGRAEILAIELPETRVQRMQGMLRWVLTPSRHSRAIIPQLKEKIKSKMEAAKFFAGFVTATLGIQLSLMLDPDRLRALDAWGARAVSLLAVAALLLALSTGFFFAVVFAYDKLLMPHSLWVEARAVARNRRPAWLVWRPPSSASWVLYQNMQRVWRYLFGSATACLLAGIVLQAWVVLSPKPLEWPKPPILFLAASVATLFGVVLRMGWPRIGSED